MLGGCLRGVWLALGECLGVLRFFFGYLEVLKGAWLVLRRCLEILLRV